MTTIPCLFSGINGSKSEMNHNTFDEEGATDEDDNPAAGENQHAKSLYYSKKSAIQNELWVVDCDVSYRSFN